MQGSTSTIAKFARSFNVEHTRSKREENVKEKVAYSEFQAFGEPFASLGTIGDIYIDITDKNCALYAKFKKGWKKWPGPTQRSTALHHPAHLTHVLWCKLDKKVLGWIPVKVLSRILISSSSHVISTILDTRRSTLQKHVKKQSKNHTLPPPTKKPRLGEPLPSSAQAGSSTDPVQNSLVNYWFSFPPFVDSIVTFIDRSVFPAMDTSASDSKPQSDAQHNATHEARRASKQMIAQNIPLPELDDDFMAESQRIMNAIMGSTKDCAVNGAVMDSLIHETQSPNPPLEEPSAPRVPFPSRPQTQAQRSNSSGSSSTLSECGPFISLANPESPATTPESLIKLLNSPIPAVKKQMISPVARKRSSWAMLNEEEMPRVGASSSAPQIKSIPSLGNGLEHSKTSSSLSTSTSVPLRKMSSPQKLHASPSLKVKGKAKASDVTSAPKEERPPSPVDAEKAKEPESPLTPQERQTLPTSNPSDRWKQLQLIPPARLNSSSASPSTSMSSSRSAVQHSKSDTTEGASEHVPLRPVQKPAQVKSLDASASPSSPSTKSVPRKGRGIDGGSVSTIIQAVRKRSPSPMNFGAVEETDNRGLNYGDNWPLPADNESHSPNSRSPSVSANIKREKGTSSPSPVLWPKKSKKAATSVSVPAALANKRPGKGQASSISARACPKQSKVVSDTGVFDLTCVDSDNDVIEIIPDRKVEKSSSVIISPTKFKVKGRDSPSLIRKLQVMPKHKRHPDHKRKATADREAKAKQQLQNELNMKSVIDLTLVSDEDEDNEIIVRPLLLVKAVPCGDGIEKQAISTVKEENVFGDIEMVDLSAPSRNVVEESDAGHGGDVDMPNSDDMDDRMDLADDEVNKDEDDKNDDGDDKNKGLPCGGEDALEDGGNDNSCEEEREFSGREGDGEMKDFVPPLAHLPEFQSDSETESSHTATDEQVDELKDEDDESEHELEDGDDLLDIFKVQLTNVHLRLLFDLDGKRYCRACLSHEPTVYWQVPPGSVELVSDQLIRHCISAHLQICEQFAAMDGDELREIERTVM